MTDDLVKRLRANARYARCMEGDDDATANDWDEAANRIEQLEAANAKWLAKWETLECEWCGSHSLRVDQRIEQLEAALREIRDAPVTALRTATVRDIARRALEES